MHLRLLREARSQARLEHPHICRIHDLGDQEGRPYIAMQLIEGKSLSDLRPELKFEETAALLADVAGAVHAAHRSGVIHRDLKPANILVEGDGPRHAYVVDFGLARDFQALDQTLSWAVLGTPAYMSPEQTRGEALGPATDIYSLGATLYAMLTGHPPFEGTTLAGLLTQQGRHGVRKVRRLNTDIPLDLETITLKCLEMAPSDRYPTALALEQDLRRFLAGEPILARPVGPLGRLLRWIRRKPALAGTAAAGLLATLLLGGWNYHSREQGRIREAAAQRFGMEIRDAEHLLRIERMMPLHDIRPAEARLRVRWRHPRERTISRCLRGPGLYALGAGNCAVTTEVIKTLESARGRFAPRSVTHWAAYYRQFASKITMWPHQQGRRNRKRWLARSGSRAWRRRGQPDLRRGGAMFTGDLAGAGT
jgi:serine/threonine-protein kinase